MRGFGTAGRVGLFYAAVFVGIGASLPYIPVWFASRGLTGVEIGLILSAPLLARVLTGPLVAVWADGFKDRRTSILIMLGGVLAAYGALAAGQGVWLWAAAWFVAASLLGAVVPLTDVLTLRQAARKGFSFGRARALGSIAFIAANLTLGRLLQGMPPWVIVAWIIVSALAALALVHVLLPYEPVTDDGFGLTGFARFNGLAGLLRDPLFLPAVIVAGAAQATHGFHYAFASLIWRSQQIDSGVIGALWAMGVAAEVAFLWYADVWRRRLGAIGLLTVGSIAATVRWALAALQPEVGWLFALQALHAFSFAATFMGALLLIERLSPRESASAAQTLNAALSGGLLMGLVTLGSGALYDAFGAGGYWVTAGLALAATLGVLLLSPRVRAREAQASTP